MDVGNLFYLVTILGLLMYSALYFIEREGIYNVFKKFVAWVVIFCFTILAFKDGEKILDDLKEGLFPSDGKPLETQLVKFGASSNRHFYIRAKVNDKEYVRFMVDTGATYVSLSSKDAERLGYDLKELMFVTPVNTANDVMYCARVDLKSIKVQDIEIKNVPAYVMEGKSNTSVLGLSFLDRLKYYYIKGKNLYIAGEKAS